MGKQKGLIKIQGTYDDFTFYESKHGHIVRKKTKFDSSRIATDPAYKRTRENMQEFTESKLGIKYLRAAFRNIMKGSSDGDVITRLNKTMTLVKSFDTLSARGARKIAAGLSDPQAQQALKEFTFYRDVKLETIMTNKLVCSNTSWDIKIANLVPAQDFNPPANVTHVNLRGAVSRIDFNTGEHETFETNTVNVALNSKAGAPVTLTASGIPGNTGIDIFVLKLEFLQEFNGVQYEFTDKAANIFSIVGIM